MPARANSLVSKTSTFLQIFGAKLATRSISGREVSSPKKSITVLSRSITSKAPWKNLGTMNALGLHPEHLFQGAHAVGISEAPKIARSHQMIEGLVTVLRGNFLRNGVEILAHFHQGLRQPGQILAKGVVVGEGVGLME